MPKSMPLPQMNEHVVRQLGDAIRRTQNFLLEQQHSEGYWVAELEGDALLQSETIMLLAFLGEEQSELARLCAVDLIDKQYPEGGWGMYPGAEPDIHNTVKGYFALKLTGHDPSMEYMERARNKVRELGGIEKVNSFTRFYLAILGQIPHNQCPAVPPQMMLLPKWFPINIYAMSSWSRTIFVPLSIVSALQPVREIPAERGIRELFSSDPAKMPPIVAPGRSLSNSFFSWDTFFRTVDRIIWGCRKIGFKPLHRFCVNKAKKWMLDRFEGSDGPGAIYPPIIWSWVALKALGYADDSPEIQYCRKQLDDLILYEPSKGRAHVQPCKSPVWDTTLTLKALMLSGMTAEHPAIRQGVNWVRSRQISRKGDWNKKVKVQPGGWAFEFNNEFYPDNDDTAMSLMILRGRFADDEGNLFRNLGSKQQESKSLESKQHELQTTEQHLKFPDRASPNLLHAFSSELRLITQETVSTVEEAKEETRNLEDVSTAMERGVNWLFGMQNKDGGWGAFDKDNTQELLCRVPFADHNAMIDPSSPDLTGRVLESLGRLGYSVHKDRAIKRAVNYLRKTQESDGSWFGRWGVHYIYGTWQALTGLSTVGVPLDDPMIVGGKNWLLAHQQPNGGWGESPNAYIDTKMRGRGNTTASQTAWAIMGLIAAGCADHPAVARGVRFLLNRQEQDGTWTEPEFTGTGFPLVFYLRYHYYSVYFPLMSLSLYARKANAANVQVKDAESTVRRSFPDQGPNRPRFCESDLDKGVELREIWNLEEELQPGYLRLFCG